MSALTMSEWLTAVRDHGINAWEHLLEEGVHPKVIASKAEKAASRGYYGYGVVAYRGWLTPKGEQFLAEVAPHATP